MWVAYLIGGSIAGLGLVWLFNKIYQNHMRNAVDKESYKNLAKAQQIKEGIENEVKKAAENHPDKFDITDF